MLVTLGKSEPGDSECSVYISTIEIYRDVFIAFDTLFLKAAQ